MALTPDAALWGMRICTVVFALALAYVSCFNLLFDWYNWGKQSAYRETGRVYVADSHAPGGGRPIVFRERRFDLFAPMVFPCVSTLLPVGCFALLYYYWINGAATAHRAPQAPPAPAPVFGRPNPLLWFLLTAGLGLTLTVFAFCGGYFWSDAKAHP